MGNYQLTIQLNGRRQSLSGPDGNEPLLYALREQAAQRGPKFGCGIAQCGACTVLVDGQPTRSCTTKVSTVASGASVETLDGLGTAQHPHPLQRAFVHQQAAQCGFCTNGLIMAAKGWLDARAAAGQTTVPSREEVAAYLSGHHPDNPTKDYLCRCGTHNRVIAAIQQAAGDEGGAA